jgi:hypothetical protein
MEPEDRDSAYIWDMLDAASAILDFIEGADFDAYLKDRKSADLAARYGAQPAPRTPPRGGRKLPPGVGGGICGGYHFALS